MRAGPLGLEQGRNEWHECIAKVLRRISSKLGGQDFYRQYAYALSGELVAVFVRLRYVVEEGVIDVGALRQELHRSPHIARYVGEKSKLLVTRRSQLLDLLLGD